MTFDRHQRSDLASLTIHSHSSLWEAHNRRHIEQSLMCTDLVWLPICQVKQHGMALSALLRNQSEITCGGPQLYPLRKHESFRWLPEWSSVPDILGVVLVPVLADGFVMRSDSDNEVRFGPEPLLQRRSNTDGR
jgi:hypothetical protein